MPLNALQSLPQYAPRSPHSHPIRLPLPNYSVPLQNVLTIQNTPPSWSRGPLLNGFCQSYTQGQLGRPITLLRMHPFPESLTSISATSLLIAYIYIAHGELRLMNTATHAIPDFFLCISHTTDNATNGIPATTTLPPHYHPHLPPTILQHTTQNPSFLNHHFLPHITQLAAPQDHPDPITFLICHSRPKPKYACIHIRQAASH